MEYKGWGLMSTPKEVAMVSSRKSIESAVEVATVDTPVSTKLCAIPGGIGGWTICKKNSLKKKEPIGYLVAGKSAHPLLGEPSTKSELDAFMDEGCEMYIIGTEGSKWVIGFTEPIDEEAEAKKFFESAIKKAAKIAKTSKEDIENRVACLRKNRVYDELILSILGSYQYVDGVVEPSVKYLPIEEKDIEGEEIEETVVCRALRNIDNGNFVLLEGPKSTGKDVLLQTIAWLCNRRFEAMTMNNEIGQPEMFGHLTTDNTPAESLTEGNLSSFLGLLKNAVKSAFKRHKTEEDENGVKPTKSNLGFIINVIKTMGTTLKFEPGFITKALLDGGKTIFVLDEFNMGRPNVLASALNTIMDAHSSTVHVPGYGNVEIPKGLIIAATQNGENDGAMSGIQMQNEATLSRFVIIRMTPSTGSMAEVFKAGDSGASDEQIELADKIFCLIRDSYLQDAISGRAVSVRNFKTFLKNIAKGQPVKNALLECVLNQCDPDEARAILSSLRAEGIM